MVGRTRKIAGGMAAVAAASAMLARRSPAPADPSPDFAAAGFTSRTLPTPAGAMVLHEAGDGAPLVFLHGIGGGASSWTWVFVAPAFARTRRVVVPDWVGWGASDHPSRFILFDDYVASLEALLDDLGAPAVVVAQSLAGGFAMTLAERRTDLFAKLILMTPSGGKDFGEDAFGPLARTTITPFAGPVAGFAFYRLLFHRRAFIAGWLRQEGFAEPARVTRRIVDAFLFNARRERAAWSALPFANGSLRYDIAPLLERVRVPASILWGARESQVGVSTGRRLAALRPDLGFTLIDGTKACPELERPATIVDLIDHILRQEP